MNDAFHIDPFSVPDDDVSGSGSEFWGADLALRIWLWLSMVLPAYAGMSGLKRYSPLAQRLLGSTQLRDAYSPFQAAQTAACDCEVCIQAQAQEPAPRPQNPRPRLTRYQRRMTARQARGIMPISRYAFHYLRRLLPRGLSSWHKVRLADRLSAFARYQGFNYRARYRRFLQCGAAAMMRAQLGALCHAPLCLE